MHRHSDAYVYNDAFNDLTISLQVEKLISYSKLIRLNGEGILNTSNIRDVGIATIAMKRDHANLNYRANMDKQ